MSRQTRERTFAVVGALVGGVMIGAQGTWGWVAVWLVAMGVWCVRPPSSRTTVIAIAVLVLSTAVAGAVDTPGRLSSAVYAVVSALLLAAIVAVCAGAVAALRQRAVHRRLGWELARVVEERERARVDEAVTSERAVMAGEIHDRLGHRLTHIAVQLGRLTLDDDVPGATRAALERVREEAAVAADELGETVTLLKAGRSPDLDPAERSLEQVVDGARVSLDVELEIDDGLESRLGPHAHAALARVLGEALTNAAKHAPGQPVEVTGRVVGALAQLTVRNPTAGPTVTPGSGHGLESLRLRLAMLGGTLEVTASDVAGRGGFVLRAQVPLDATPAAVPIPTPVGAAELDQTRRTRRLSRLAWLVPLALAVPAAVFAVGYYLFAAVASVLPPERYAALEVGMTQREADALLPVVEMLDEPSEVLPVPAGATCEFYESVASLFDREDVYRVCFTEGVLSRLDTIPSP
ncbi:histidine kinase [Cellulomonas sp.]|uniref:sensor histidine kinase n=1 Tax=Cellulomonas sp. TaxID=40001 RepID=UPI002810DEBE|nr:histidine kinase [Cellulomonas sp.]